jgi:hypothetical protein
LLGTPVHGSLFGMYGGCCAMVLFMHFGYWLNEALRHAATPTAGGAAVATMLPSTADDARGDPPVGFVDSAAVLVCRIGSNRTGTNEMPSS